MNRILECGGEGKEIDKPTTPFVVWVRGREGQTRERKNQHAGLEAGSGCNFRCIYHSDYRRTEPCRAVPWEATDVLIGRKPRVGSDQTHCDMHLAA